MYQRILTQLLKFICHGPCKCTNLIQRSELLHKNIFMLYTAISITVVHGKTEKSSTSTKDLLGYWIAINVGTRHNTYMNKNKTIHTTNSLGIPQISILIFIIRCYIIAGGKFEIISSTNTCT